MQTSHDVLTKQLVSWLPVSKEITMQTIQVALKIIYGRDTRGIQMLNLYVHIVWLVMILMYLSDNNQVGFIGNVLTHIPTLLVLTIALIFTIILSLRVIRERHQILKVFGLLLGSVIQGIISSGYVKAYPPLDTMSIFCISLCIWFAGAALYVIKMEGFNYGVKLYNPTSYRK